MNLTCLRCGNIKKEKNKYCSLSCANKSRKWTPESLKRLSIGTKIGMNNYNDEKLGEKENHKSACIKCNNEIIFYGTDLF